MDNYTIWDFKSGMPVRCQMQRLAHDRMRMHDDFELSLIVSGSGMLTIDDGMYHFGPDDVFAVGPHTLHELRSADCVIVSILFDQTAFEQSLPAPFHPTFFCLSSIQEKESAQKKEAFDTLRSLTAQMVKNNVDQLSGYELRTWSLVYNIMDVLYNNFRTENSLSRETRSYKYSLRIAEITRIVRDRYTENLSLSDISEEVHLSVPYLSKFFTEHFGMNFMTYLTQYRLNHAVGELLRTDKNIDEIALESGFSSSHAFVTAFRREFDMLPNAYRKKEKNKKVSKNLIEKQHSYMSGLKKYLRTESAAKVLLPEKETLITFSAAPDTSRTYPLRHTWKTLMTVGGAEDILLSNVQQMLKRMHDEIGFRYIRFNGIFSDRLLVVTKDRKGRVVYNFTYIDAVLDTLMRIGLKPWIQLSYMPKILALHPDKYVFNDNVSQPGSNDAWCSLISAFLIHIRERYGTDEIRSWQFSLWNLPDTSDALFGFDTDGDFRAFYKASFDAIKSVDPALSVSLPPSYYITNPGYENAWVSFIKWCGENDCLPDTLSFAYYDTKLLFTPSQASETFGFPYMMSLSENPDSFKDFVMDVNLKKRELGLRKMPVYLTEWNNTPSQQDLLNDTCYKACYIVKNILENYDRLESFGFWSLTDLMSDAPLPNEPFFGGGGLFTRNGIPKASFFAFGMLGKLGDALITRGDGYFITRSGHHYQILLYNYQHFSSLYANGEKFDMTRTDRYTVFADKAPVTVHLTMHGFPEKRCRVREYYVNQDAGSAYDTWVRNGAPDLFSKDEENYLSDNVHPGYYEHRIEADAEGTFRMDVTLRLLEIRLIVLTPGG